MSQLVQGKTGAFTDATDAPDSFWNGIPMEANGSLAIDDVTAIAFHHQGLPFTALGRLAVDIGGVVASINNGAMPLTAAGRLAVVGSVSGVSSLAANAYTASGQLILSPTGGGFSPQVTAVFARMSALDQTEQDAIETYVDGLVADGLYANITEIYAPCLNATDFLTGFKFMTAIQSVPAPVHTAGEYVDFTGSNMHWLDSADFSSFAAVEGFLAAYIVFTGADVTQNSDLFGVADATNECYMRWRGTDTNDFNALYNVTLATPRTIANLRPTGDVVGMGLEGVDLFNLQPGGFVSKATRVTTAVPLGHPLQWHGQNLNGTPAVGNVQPSRYSLMIEGNGIIDTNAVQIRVRSLQFLRDIGVTGVPAT